MLRSRAKRGSMVRISKARGQHRWWHEAPQVHSLGHEARQPTLHHQQRDQEAFPLGSHQWLRNWLWAESKQQMWGNRIKKALMWNEISDLTAASAEVICRTFIHSGIHGLNNVTSDTNKTTTWPLTCKTLLFTEWVTALWWRGYCNNLKMMKPRLRKIRFAQSCNPNSGRGSFD